MITKTLLEKHLDLLHSYQRSATSELRECKAQLVNIQDRVNNLTKQIIECEEALLNTCEHTNCSTSTIVTETDKYSITLTTLSCDDCGKFISSTQTTNA